MFTSPKKAARDFADDDENDKPMQGYNSLSLRELRDDLRSKLSTYKLPTVLRVVPEFKKTASLKIPKALIKKELFETGHPDVQRWETKQSKL